MSTGVEGWVHDIPGFDAARWWAPIVCTHGTGGHTDAEMLGVVYEFNDDPGELRWHSRPFDPDTMEPGIGAMQMWENTDTGERHIGDKGSMRIRCSRGCSPRIPAERFGEWLTVTRDAGLPWLDVSR